ncbi:helix-turn-helix domain-containing protein [Salinirubellus salinus]|uniref:Helix-turn-helix domain-containing protein n=1 Tax=Salinirubellus salinus TaxID=1364945 RepID=A0A9E7R387_9EURY|nr:helix-turn-helix domain-containing protein [Salinirubellus salinus]UWM53978.1 helix-turn-helix domain-containing protein [Salinirubellus salinus]
MHEFSFSIEWAPGSDRFADAFRERSSLQASGVCISFRPERMLRLESVTGETGDLTALDRLLLDESFDHESISDRDLDARRHHDLLTDTATRRVVHTYLDDIRRRDAIPVIVSQYTEDGTLVETFRSGPTVRYRVLVRGDEKLGMMYDTITARLGEGATFTFHHLEEVDRWQNGLLTPRALRGSQREILVHAVERGYFEVPREVSLQEVADDLGIPQSTASYRLRRATAQLAEQFTEQYQIDT